MNLKQLLFTLAAALIFAACTEILPEEQLEIQINDLAPASLENGISTLLTPEQTRLFDVTELKELDQFVKDPESTIEFRNEDIVKIPAGSQDVLAAAIEEAPEGGTILLESGDHIESGSIEISKNLSIVGEAGANLISGVQPEDQVGFVQAAIHVKGSRVVIRNLNFQTAAAVGGTAIILEEASKSIILRNNFDNFQYSILIEKSNNTRIAYNNINTTLAWTTGDIAFAYGMVNINGKNTRILANTFTGGQFGVWPCDRGGLFIGNECSNNVWGMILCTVPEVGGFIFPDGTPRGSAVSGSSWLVSYNSSHDNFDTGYIVIDNANNNFLYYNKAANNARYDIELAGDSERFGFSTPTSFENRVVALPGQTVKDCGIDNIMRGGTTIDTNVDPCF